MLRVAAAETPEVDVRLYVCFGVSVGYRPLELRNVCADMGSACVISMVRLVTMVPALHSMNYTAFKVQVGQFFLLIFLPFRCTC